MDSKERKLTFLRDSFWNNFVDTGSIYAYGRYRGADQLLKEHQASKNSQPEFE